VEGITAPSLRKTIVASRGDYASAVDAAAEMPVSVDGSAA
jgi:hypothetical protein